MPSRFTFQWDEQVINAVIRGQNGIAGREVRERGERIKLRAQQLVGVDSGRLRASIFVRNFTILGNPAVVIGYGTRYGNFHHNGTGLWGPTGQVIRPKTARALRFKPKGRGFFVYAAYVRGSKPNPFLRDAIIAGADPPRRPQVAAALATRSPAWVGNVSAGRNAAQIGNTDWVRSVSGGRTAGTPGGWSRSVSGGAPASGRSAGSSGTQRPTGWARNVSGGARSRSGHTGWDHRVGPGPRPRRGRR